MTEPAAVSAAELGAALTAAPPPAQVGVRTRRNPMKRLVEPGGVGAGPVAASASRAGRPRRPQSSYV